MKLPAGKALLFVGVFFAFGALSACSEGPDMSASAEEVSGEALPPEAGASALLPYPDDTAPPAPLVDETSAELALLSEESPSDKRAAAETGELSHEKTDLANAAFGYELGEKTTELRAETDSSDASPQDVYFDADKRLRRYTVDDELMAILQTEPRLNLITGDANTIIRVNYDEHGRLLTRTVWEVPFESAADTLNTEEKIKSTADMPETTEKTEPVAATSESSEKTKKMEPAAFLGTPAIYAGRNTFSSAEKSCSR